MSESRELVVGGVRAVRRSAIWWSVGIATFIVVNLAFWPSLEGSEALEGFEDMADLMEAFGAQNIATPSGYVDGQVYALLLPLLLSALAITLASGLTAGDENTGRLELLHALPVGRRQVWLARWSAAALVLVGVGAVGGVSTLVSLPLFSLTEVSAGRVVMAGTSSTRNTSGTAKSIGSDSGTADPTSTPTIVHTCQLPHRSSALPR